MMFNNMGFFTIFLIAGACVCVFSLFNAFMMGFFDKRANRILKKSVDHSKGELN